MNIFHFYKGNDIGIDDQGNYLDKINYSGLHSLVYHHLPQKQKDPFLTFENHHLLRLLKDGSNPFDFNGMIDLYGWHRFQTA